MRDGHRPWIEFDDNPEAPGYVGLRLDDALARARSTGALLRVFDTSTKGPVVFTADYRSERINLLVADGVVARAALF